MNSISLSQALKEAKNLEPLSISTGILQLDKRLTYNGIIPGKLLEICGPPGSGRTAIGLKIVLNYIFNNTSTDRNDNTNNNNNVSQKILWIDTKSPMPITRLLNMSEPENKSLILKSISHVFTPTLTQLIGLFVKNPYRNTNLNDTDKIQNKFPPEGTQLLIIDDLSFPISNAFNPSSINTKLNSNSSSNNNNNNNNNYNEDINMKKTRILTEFIYSVKRSASKNKYSVIILSNIKFATHYLPYKTLPNSNSTMNSPSQSQLSSPISSQLSYNDSSIEDINLTSSPSQSQSQSSYKSNFLTNSSQKRKISLIVPALNYAKYSQAFSDRVMLFKASPVSFNYSEILKPVQKSLISLESINNSDDLDLLNIHPDFSSTQNITTNLNNLTKQDKQNNNNIKINETTKPNDKNTQSKTNNDNTNEIKNNLKVMHTKEFNIENNNENKNNNKDIQDNYKSSIVGGKTKRIYQIESESLSNIKSLNDNPNTKRTILPDNDDIYKHDNINYDKKAVSHAIILDVNGLYPIMYSGSNNNSSLSPDNSNNDKNTNENENKIIRGYLKCVPIPFEITTHGVCDYPQVSNQNKRRKIK